MHLDTNTEYENSISATEVTMEAAICDLFYANIKAAVMASRFPFRTVSFPILMSLANLQQGDDKFQGRLK